MLCCALQALRCRVELPEQGQLLLAHWLLPLQCSRSRSCLELSRLSAHQQVRGVGIGHTT